MKWQDAPTPVSLQLTVDEARHFIDATREYFMRHRDAFPAPSDPDELDGLKWLHGKADVIEEYLEGTK